MKDDRLEVEYEEDDGDQPKPVEVKFVAAGTDLAGNKGLESINERPDEKSLEVTQNFCTLCKIIQVNFALKHVIIATSSQTLPCL